MSKPLPKPKEALMILRENGCPNNVIYHCKTVAKIAVQIAKKCLNNGVYVDIELVKIGALLHDIGRANTHEVNHPIVGAKIAREIGLPDSLIRIIERHLGGGVTDDEARMLGWPSGTYVPETLEEKIVTYADKLVDGKNQVPIEKTIQKLSKKLGNGHPSIQRILLLHEEISKICNQ
ncbi:MAG: TIGR00295 family protein [Candidatus Jordarchaeaceae archaeon]